MPDKTLRVKIDGKEYSLEGQMTLGEQRLFKQIGGIRLGELEDALDMGDQDALIALAIILKRRAHEKFDITDAEQIVELEIIDPDEKTGDTSPPLDPAADSPGAEPAAIAQLPSRATNPTDSGNPSSLTGSG